MQTVTSNTQHEGITASSVLFRYQTLAVTLLVTVSMPRTGQAAAGDGLNAAEFRALCHLAAIADLSADATTLPTIDPNEKQEIEMLNMSASQATWQAAFPAPDQPDPEPEPACKSDDSMVRCLKDYQTFKQLKATLKSESAAEKTGDKHKLVPAIQETPEGRRVQRQLHDLAAESAEVISSYDSQHSQLKQKLGAALTSILKEALYGAGTTATGENYDDKWTATATLSTDCTHQKAGTSIRGDLASLCINDSATNKQMCGHTVGPDNSNNWQASATATNINGLVSKCKTLVKPKLSAQTIRAALANFDAKLRSHTGGGKDAIVLGTPHSAGSCGGQANVASVDYTEQLPPAEDGAQNKISWYRHLDQAANTLQELQATKIERQHTLRRLTALRKRAYSLYNTLKIVNNPHTTKGTEIHAKEQNTKENKCKSAINKTAAGCAAIDCEYDAHESD
ncbi:Trypanosomal VSG domain containing protein, putative [Trypanosoma equiperdum]|uniref:Trypanosomal VSG domain containing protein, putative n=1 Tax=Trypanosoma equiperdum TaxID=5694 RepID=A0A1G4IID2_TRYEQ|nr:Trypanosomal VSG domain containing protein, putative [Trypanosoma equiperdum]